MGRVVSQGEGPEFLFIHGSATDHTTFGVQLATLRKKLRMVAYDRPVADTRSASVESQADRTLAVFRETGLHRPIIVGSSFGAVVALQFARAHPTLTRALVLCEPPLPASDYQPSAPYDFICRFDGLAEGLGGEAAAEYFLRGVLGDAAFEKMPSSFQKKAVSTHAAIRADMAALSRYHPRYADLDEELSCPLHLVGGGQSAAFYAETLDALEASVPSSLRTTFENAGHMTHVDAFRQFNALLLELDKALP